MSKKTLTRRWAATAEKPADKKVDDVAEAEAADDATGADQGAGDTEAPAEAEKPEKAAKSAETAAKRGAKSKPSRTPLRDPEGTIVEIPAEGVAALLALGWTEA